MQDGDISQTARDHLKCNTRTEQHPLKEGLLVHGITEKNLSLLQFWLILHCIYDLSSLLPTRLQIYLYGIFSLYDFEYFDEMVRYVPQAVQ
jgi:hypothetical protein